jgi:FkbM family methyltransferase
MSNLIRRLRGQAPLVRIDLVGLPRFRMETHGRDDVFVSRAIEDWGNWEGNSTAIVLQLLRNPADFIDIGANIGWYTLVAAHALGDRGHVHSFEPDPAHLAKLSVNVAVNHLDNVTMNELALSDRTGTATLHLNPLNRGDNSLLPFATRRGSALVKLARLDDYPGLNGERPLVIKIDVQGSEIDVLAGARRLLESYRREIVLLCEISPSALAAGGRTAQELACMLDGLGFLAARIDRTIPRIIPMSWTRVAQILAAEDARNPGADGDVVAYRRIDGLMAPIFAGAGFRQA